MTVSGLSGTTALVTGATRGFGRAIAGALHEAGANVVAVARNAEQLGQLQPPGAYLLTPDGLSLLP
jgi:NAD(P)-dependent dehydrogenase (short-subunit alcohol dehydrogenase family)